LPVIGITIKTKILEELDSLLSIVQMSKGVPGTTVGINNASNAALFAARILALENHQIKLHLDNYMSKMS